jgi:hypothetical protein
MFRKYTRMMLVLLEVDRITAFKEILRLENNNIDTKFVTCSLLSSDILLS